jgi:hypothetical protein
MNKKGWEVWNNITFKTQGYRKNFDLITENENIISEYVGNISILRISEHKPSVIIGEYTFSVWDISLARILKINLNKLLDAHYMVEAYVELIKMIKKDEIDVNYYDKIVLIHSLVIHPEYRKISITEEFIEFIYRDYHFNKTAILAIVQPFQNNKYDLEYYMEQKTVSVYDEHIGSNKINIIPAANYYSLDKFILKNDVEMNEYKLFAVANRCGFNRIDESHLFILSPEKIIERIKDKKAELPSDNKIVGYNESEWDINEIV